MASIGEAAGPDAAMPLLEGNAIRMQNTAGVRPREGVRPPWVQGTEKALVLRAGGLLIEEILRQPDRVHHVRVDALRPDIVELENPLAGP